MIAIASLDGDKYPVENPRALCDSRGLSNSLRVPQMDAISSEGNHLHCILVYVKMNTIQ